MPWSCPACRLPIGHNEFENRPRPGQRYRCHVCRLELVLDPQTNKLVPAPSEGEDDREHSVRRAP